MLGDAVQLSVAVASEKDTFAPHWFAVLPCVIFAGQLIAGCIMSITITSKEQVDWLLAASVAVSVTRVVPVIMLPGTGD